MKVITLTTDFGTADEYVGVLKGVICDIDPDIRVIDVTHHIPPHDVPGAAFLLKAAFTWFPNGSVHVAVVDPGVGTSRAIIGARAAGHFFIAPDNGLLVPLIQAYGVDELVAVRPQAYLKQPLSRTFHGRDVFAPVAARIAGGAPLKNFGPPLEHARLTDLAWPAVHQDTAERVQGHVVWVDRFGNLITDIHAAQIKGLAQSGGQRQLCIHAGGRCISGLVESYSQAPKGTPAAIIGSRGCLEIAVNQGSAAKVLAIGSGAPVAVFLQERGRGEIQEDTQDESAAP